MELGPEMVAEYEKQMETMQGWYDFGLKNWGIRVKVPMRMPGLFYPMLQKLK